MKLNLVPDTPLGQMREYNSNKWFIVSVVITVFLIILLVWNLVHSYNTIKAFEDRKLALERASGELLFHTKNMEMSVHMAAATGDLRWQEEYMSHQPELSRILEKIPGLLDLDEGMEETAKIHAHLNEITYIENQAFNLISRGQKEEASQLLSGWAYTKNQLELTESTENLAEIMHGHVSQTITFESRLTFILLVFVLLCLVVLVVSWVITIRIWGINQRKRQEKEDEITYLSYHDSLTGLYNRRYFEEEFNRLNVKRQLPLTIIIGDVNNLKKANDTLGHKKGDELLVEISRILKKAVREEDIVSRWGGDEFGIILPNTSFKDAQKIVDRIKEGCEQSDFKPIRPSISLGFAVKTDITQDIDNVFTSAENRMYRKKRLTKNA